jgi:hypothetical protein
MQQSRTAKRLASPEAVNFGKILACLAALDKSKFLSAGGTVSEMCSCRHPLSSTGRELDGNR